MMTWWQTCDNPSSEPVSALFADVYMPISASLKSNVCYLRGIARTESIESYFTFIKSSEI